MREDAEGRVRSTVRERNSKAKEKESKRRKEEARERERRGGRERETEKVIKEIMDGSLRELQRTNSHFQFASW